VPAQVGGTFSTAGRLVIERLRPPAYKPGALPVWLVGGILFLFGFAGEMRSGLNGDSAWLLHAAGRVAGGARLYTDVVEVNPPLIVWLNVIVVAVARLLHASEITTYRIFVWGLVGLALWLADRMLGSLREPDDSRYRRGLLLGAALILLALPGPYFGQREHLTLAMVLPWIIATAARVRGRPPADADAVTAGLLAGLGVALKPHYLLLPLGLALYGWLRSADRRLRLPPEHAALATLLGLYAVATLAFAPAYLEAMVRLGSIYWEYGRRSVGAILGATLMPLTVLGSLLLWPAMRRLTRYPELADALGIATAALFAAVLLQHKGFGYHYYPAIGTGLLLLFTGLLGGSARPLSPALRTVCAALALLAVVPSTMLFLGTAAARAGGSWQKRPIAAGTREMAAFLRSHPAQGAVVVFSPWMEDSFPLILESRVEWGSRYPFLWFLPALYREALASGDSLRYRSGAEMSAAERRLIRGVAEDLGRYQPVYVFVRRPGGPYFLEVDILAALQQDAEFAKEFAPYRPTMELEHFRVFERMRT
jgi:hypothetical protein